MNAPSPPPPAAVDIALLDESLRTRMAPWLSQLGLRITQARPGEVTLDLPVTPAHVHGGGVVCGQTVMAACDTAMVLAIVSQLGSFRPMTTVQLQTSFLRGIPGDSGSARVVARVLRLGRKLVFGEIEVFAADGELAAHATTTYALM